MLVEVAEGSLDIKFEVGLLCRISRNGGVYFVGVESGVESGVQRCYASTPCVPAGPPPTKTAQYLSNHRAFPHQNQTQESPLLSLSNAPSFIQFHAAVLEIAFTHNISTTT